MIETFPDCQFDNDLNLFFSYFCYLFILKANVGDDDEKRPGKRSTARLNRVVLRIIILAPSAGLNDENIHFFFLILLLFSAVSLLRVERKGGRRLGHDGGQDATAIIAAPLETRAVSTRPIERSTAAIYTVR